MFLGYKRLNEKLASLNRFLAKSAERSLSFFKTLKKCTKKSYFQWTAEAKVAFKQMKKLISELPTLTAPMENEELIVYLAATREAVSAVLMTEREAKQMPIHFISCALQDGSSCIDGSGAGLILTSTEGTEFTYALRFEFDAINNETEYEALIAGLRIAEQMGIKNLQTYVDSRLVANQVNGSYIAKEPGPRSVVAKAIRTRYYWPTMHEDARKVIRECQYCQVYRPVPRNPQQKLTPITSPWSFYKWGIDIAGPFPEGLGKAMVVVFGWWPVVGCNRKTLRSFCTIQNLLTYRIFNVFGWHCYPTNDSENLGKLQPKADIGIFIGYAPTKKAFQIYNRRTRRIIETIHVDFDELTAMASEHSSSGPALHEMTPATIGSGLVQTSFLSNTFVSSFAMSGICVSKPLFDEFLNPSPSVDHPAPEVVAPSNEVIAPVLADSTGSPSSTTVDQDAPSPSNSQTTPETEPPIIPNDVEEDNHDIEVAHMGNDPYFGVLILEIPSDQSSSSDSIHTIVHPDHQISEHNSKWTKDHPLENIIDELARPVSTRLQLHEQALFCYYDAFLTAVEPKTYKLFGLKAVGLKQLQETY
ncbi:retrovirus-related pol polyprotein from transposon TNT 1-94 [Tanacetum coccineum]